MIGASHRPASSTRLPIGLAAVWLLGVMLPVPHGAQGLTVTGAILNGNTGTTALDRGHRTRRIGDTLTILLATPASGNVRDALPVTIAEMRPDGTVLVRGSKQMLRNQGDQWVRFSAIVRLSDIDADRTIAVTRIADARIEYSGQGALQRASRQGWLGRLFDIVSPS